MEKDPKNMTVDECLKWLTANPLVDLADIAYLLYMERDLYNSLIPGQVVPASRSEVASVCGANWDLITWLCLIHCVMDNRARVALLNCHTSLNWCELDTKNSQDVCLPTFEELVATLFNNELISYESIALDLSLSWKLVDPMRLDFSDTICEKINPQKVKECFGGLQASVVMVSDFLFYWQ
jgi:hypothetical protein